MVTDSVTDMTTRYNVISWIWNLEQRKDIMKNPMKSE